MRKHTAGAVARSLWDKIGPYDIHSDVEAAVADVERNIKSVNVSKDWLERARAYNRNFTHTPASSSYALKHRVEAWCGHWICHSAFLVAANEAGVKIDPYPITRPNGLREFYTTVPDNHQITKTRKK